MNNICDYKCGRESTGFIKGKRLCETCYLDRQDKYGNFHSIDKPIQNNRPISQVSTGNLNGRPVRFVFRETSSISQLSSEEEDIGSSYVIGLNGGFVVRGRVVWPDGRPLVLFSSHLEYFNSIIIFQEEAGIDPTVWSERTVQLAECLNAYGVRNFRDRNMSLTPFSEIERLRGMITPEDDLSSSEDDIPDLAPALSLQEAREEFERASNDLEACRRNLGDSCPEYYQLFHIYYRSLNILNQVTVSESI